MDKEVEEAKASLEKCLSHPSELGKKPSKIEYTRSFTDKDGIKCIIFKYKKSMFDKWLLGIVSDSGTFSDMKEYNKDREIEDATIIVEKLKNYWKQRAKKTE